MNKVCPFFCPLWNWLFSFSGAEHGVRGPCGVIYDRAGFFENNSFARKIGKNRPSLGFFECIGKFSHQFVLNFVDNQSLY